MTTPAQSSQHEFSYIPEVTYGTTPTSPALKTLPITGTTLALAKTKIISQTIRPDRQIFDVRHGNRQIGGDIAHEFAYGAHDDLLEALFCGTWAARIGPYTADTISALASDNSINDSAAGFPAFVLGDYIYIPGTTIMGQVASRTTSKIVLETLVPLTDHSAGASLSVTCAPTLVPGTTRRSFSFVRKFTDIGEAQTFTGCELNNWTLSVEPDKIVESKITVLGRERIDAEPGGATYAAVTGASNKSFDSFTGAVKVDFTAVAIITKLMLTVDNGLTTRFTVFQDKTNPPKVGKTTVSGSMTLYFVDSTFLAMFNGAAKFTLEFSLTDGLGNTYRFLLPSNLPDGGQADVQGDNDITITLPFSAIYEDGADTPEVIRLSRVPHS